MHKNVLTQFRIPFFMPSCGNASVLVCVCHSLLYEYVCVCVGHSSSNSNSLCHMQISLHYLSVQPTVSGPLSLSPSLSLPLCHSLSLLFLPVCLSVYLSCCLTTHDNRKSCRCFFFLLFLFSSLAFVFVISFFICGFISLLLSVCALEIPFGHKWGKCTEIVDGVSKRVIT